MRPPPLHVLRRRARHALRRRGVRVAAGLVVLAAVVAVDLQVIAPWLEPRIDGLPPDHQKVFAGEELALTELSSEPPLLALEDSQGVKVIADFPRARFEEGFGRNLSGLGISLPNEPLYELVYTTTATRLARPGLSPCRSRLTLTAATAATAAAGGPEKVQLVFSQQVDNASPELLPLRLSSPTNALIVDITDGPTAELGVGDFLDCGSLLIGDLPELSGVHHVRVEVPAGQPFDLFFHSLAGDEVVALVGPGAVLRAAGVQVRSTQDPEQKPMLRVTGDGRSLDITDLKIGRQQLELSYKGEGIARGVRAPEGPAPFERFRKGLLLSPLFSLFLGILHLALFQLLRRALWSAASA
ncbi:MAG: hypothetical protein AAF560_33570 [Acidobacteriota bacterium]